MIVTIVIILLVLLFAGSIESNLREAFSGDWMRFDEPQEPNVTNKEVAYGIRLVIRNSGDLYEWYGDDQSKRDRRFETLIRVLC